MTSIIIIAKCRITLFVFLCNILFISWNFDSFHSVNSFQKCLSNRCHWTRKCASNKNHILIQNFLFDELIPQGKKTDRKQNRQKIVCFFTPRWWEIIMKSDHFSFDIFDLKKKTKNRRYLGLFSFLWWDTSEARRRKGKQMNNATQSIVSAQYHAIAQSFRFSSANFRKVTVYLSRLK